MTHVLFAILSGLLVGAAWAGLDPLSVGHVPAAGAGFLVGVVGYALIYLLDSLDERGSEA